jgi:putative transposase
MPQSLSNLYIHIVFSTKERVRFFQNHELRQEMHAYLAQIFKEYESPALLVGGVEDHVHILCNLSRSHDLASVCREVKRNSTKWIKVRDPELSTFSWQSGYGAFSVSRSKLEEVRSYIANQEAHHKKMSFQDELRAILRKQGIEIDERYLWD